MNASRITRTAAVVIAFFLVVTTTLIAQETPVRTPSRGTLLRPATEATGTGTQNFIAKWADNAGLLGNSIIFETAGNLGVSTTNPVAKLQVGAAGADLPNMPGTTLYVTGVGPTGAAGIVARDVVNHVELAIGTAGLGGGQFVGLFGTRTAHDLYLQAGGNNFMVVKASGAIGIGTMNPTSTLDLVGNIKVSGNIAAKYQDVAEWVPTEGGELDGGTLVVLSQSKTNTVRASAEAYDTRVAGVISEQPGIILGESTEGDSKAMVATTGRVRVRAETSNGPIAIGDLLVTSGTAGYAMRSSPVEVAGVKMHRPGTIIGKALEPLAEGKGEILVLLTLQ